MARAKSDGRCRYAQKETFERDSADAALVLDACEPPARGDGPEADFAAALSCVTLTSVPWDCAPWIPDFTLAAKPGNSFVMQDSEVKVRSPPQVSAGVRTADGVEAAWAPLTELFADGLAAGASMVSTAPVEP